MALRRRVKRDLTMVAGVVIILIVIVVVNYGSNVAKLASKFEAIRKAVEEKQSSHGVDFLSWKLMLRFATIVVLVQPVLMRVRHKRLFSRAWLTATVVFHI